MKQKDFNEGLLNFIEASPTPYHAVNTMVAALESAGFEALPESETWLDEQGQPYLEGRYYITRNDSSLIAFTTGNMPIEQNGFRMMGAHTDSPCLKIKPSPDLQQEGCAQVGVEVYGGALLNPWFDRDLSIAGKINYLNTREQLESTLIDLGKPIAVIPSLAIHLDREANRNRTINPQKDLCAILGGHTSGQSGSSGSLRQIIEDHLVQVLNIDVLKVLDFDLSFYDTQPPKLMGLNNDYIASARLDNLLSCYTGLIALLNAEKLNTMAYQPPTLLVCTDHEEVGSQSYHGARSNFLYTVLQRLFGHVDTLTQVIDRSTMISCDNAHAVHPNYSDVHDPHHRPKLNAGPVIKYNASQSYATNSETAALFRWLCQQVSVKTQDFVMRSDLRCGSTIGPMTSASLGIRTLDVGAPQWAMHSIREIAGSRDAHQLCKVLTAYLMLEKMPY